MAAVNGVDDRLYTRHFFQMFAAVMLFMTGVALQFHFGQYVAHVGYGVDTFGWILSIAMVGTLCIRLHVGGWIDRFGCRPTWLIGTLTVALAVGAIQFVSQLWLLVVLRAIWAMAMASVMTTVPVFAAGLAPPPRRAEAIGMIGLAGFTGMIVGPTLGDWIFAGAGESIVPYHVFFSASAALSLLSGAVMLLVSPKIAAVPRPIGETCGPDSRYGDGACAPVPPSTNRGKSRIEIILAHWPGAVLLVGVVFSMSFCLQNSFLERLAEARGFMDIKVFFLVYGPTAMILRVLCRRVPQRIGRSRTLVGGLLLFAIGIVCLVGVHSQGGLVLPAMLMGAGHCFIFPSMVDLAAERFPPAHRGTGTAVIMAAGDVGMLIGYVGMGELIDALGFDVAIIALAVTVLIGTAAFAVARRESIVRGKGQG